MYRWIYDKAAKGGPGVPQLILNIYVTKGGDDLDTSFFIKGRPSFPEVFDSLVKDNTGKPMMVFVCGPKQIVNQTWDLSMKKNRDGHKIHFHHETFEF